MSGAMAVVQGRASRCIIQVGLWADGAKRGTQTNTRTVIKRRWRDRAVVRVKRGAQSILDPRGMPPPTQPPPPPLPPSTAAAARHCAAITHASRARSTRPSPVAAAGRLTVKIVVFPVPRARTLCSALLLLLLYIFYVV